MFITFEGGEGCGKSVQSKLLYDYLIARGKNVTLTREPGGSAVSEEIRHILLKGDIDKLAPITETLLYMAARSELWIKTIRPTLNAGGIVISDRSQDSTVVYQGICKGVDRCLIESIFRSFSGNAMPDRTYVIDIAPSIGIARSMSRDGNDETRFEKMGLKFHEAIRNAFLSLAQEDPKRFVVLDGALPATDIHDAIVTDLIRICHRKLKL
ncbi:MAG: dTMP kinase [Holosporales bacterium]|nr:dTMP kinase [Holosporales bacterium]